MNTKIDRRTVDRYVEKGLIKKSDYESYLKSLTDDSNNATWVQMDLEETEISGRNGGGETGGTEGA